MVTTYVVMHLAVCSTHVLSAHRVILLIGELLRGVRHNGMDCCYIMQLCALTSGNNIILEVLQIRFQRGNEALWCCYHLKLKQRAKCAEVHWNALRELRHQSQGNANYHFIRYFAPEYFHPAPVRYAAEASSKFEKLKI